MPEIEIHIGDVKVYSIAGSSSFTIGRSESSGISSQSKTNNGVGNAYGDGSYFNMSPYQSSLYDTDHGDFIDKRSAPYSYPSSMPYFKSPYSYYTWQCYYPYYPSYYNHYGYNPPYYSLPSSPLQSREKMVNEQSFDLPIDSQRNKEQKD